MRKIDKDVSLKSKRGKMKQLVVKIICALRRKKRLCRWKSLRWNSSRSSRTLKQFRKMLTKSWSAR